MAFGQTFLIDIPPGAMPQATVRYGLRPNVVLNCHCSDSSLVWVLFSTGFICLFRRDQGFGLGKKQLE
jgi:hypothetical protein